MSWHRAYTKEGAAVHVVLEIDEAAFVVDRIKGKLSESSKLSDKLWAFARMAEQQEAREVEVDAVCWEKGLDDLDEMQKLYELRVLDTRGS